MTTLDLANIQGFVIRGYRLPYAAYLFLRIDDATRARALLGEVLPQVITAARWTEKPESGINVAVSHAGLRALGIEVRQELPGVGENLRDHYAPRTRWLVGQKGVTFNDRARGLGMVYQAARYAVFRKGFLASVGAPLYEQTITETNGALCNGRSGNAELSWPSFSRSA